MDLAKPAITLNNGVVMPMLGLGTWKMDDGAEVEEAVRYALEIGYRHIDTATLYGNERGVGKAVRESASPVAGLRPRGIPREEIFIATKLWPTDFFNPEKAFDKSLSLLGLDYVDLYLVHWPIPMMPKSVWKAMEKIYEQKGARAIGVSNYGIGDIEKLLDYCTIPPAVNQIKFSPFDYAEEIAHCCREHRIALEAYSPLTRGAQLDHPDVMALAKKYKKTSAQIMIRWCIEHEAIVIPKSSRPERIKENADVFDFEIAPEDMHTLDDLS